MLPSSPFPVVIFLWQFLIVGFSFVASLVIVPTARNIIDIGIGIVSIVIIAIVVVVGVRLDGGYSYSHAAAAFWIFSLIFL